MFRRNERPSQSWKMPGQELYWADCKHLAFCPQYNILGYVKRFDSYETIGECRDYSSHEGNKHLMMLFETYLKVHKVAWNSNAIVELIIKSVEQFSKHVFVVHHASEFLQLACIIGVFEP